MIIGIDPGPKQSGLVVLHADGFAGGYVESNEDILVRLEMHAHSGEVDAFACEWIENMGMSVGAEVFHACRWVGRFEQALAAHKREIRLVTRRSVKLHICGSMRAKDPNVRQAIIDLYGGKEAAIGRKKTPGPLYSVKAHAWSALAVALTARDGAA